MKGSLAEIRAERGDVFTAGCPTRTVLDHVMSKWGALVLLALTDGTQRWGELRRRADGVSDKMLAATLRTLERDGLVRRQAYPEIPPRVEYTLTALGEGLMAHMLPMCAWIAEHADEITGRSTAA
jgi:DNA-binding HxlR family transcriptional regulator